MVTEYMETNLDDHNEVNDDTGNTATISSMHLPQDYLDLDVGLYIKPGS